MSRYIKDFQVNGNSEAFLSTINQFLLSEGFDYCLHNGENVFKKGHGVIAAPQFIKITPFPGIIRLEAWIKVALLPGVYIGESTMESGFGIAVKIPLRKTVKYIEDMLIYSSAPINNSIPPVSVTYYPTNNTYPQEQNIPAQKKFCTICGSNLSTSATFCPKCGNKTM